MTSFAGLDVSEQATHVWVVDAADLERAVLETGALASRLIHGLAALGVPVVCVSARQAHASIWARARSPDGPSNSAGQGITGLSGRSNQSARTSVASRLLSLALAIVCLEPSPCPPPPRPPSPKPRA